MKMLDAIDRGEPLDALRRRQPGVRLRRTSSDCAEANICAMRADTVDRAYNVGTGIRTSIRELAEMLLRITGCDVGIRYLPEGVTFVRNRIGSTEQAPEEIGFQARRSTRGRAARAHRRGAQAHQQPRSRARTSVRGAS